MKDRFFQVTSKFILAIALLIILGLPIIDFWKMFILLMGWLALINCEVRQDKWRMSAAVAIIVLLLVVKSLLPKAGIEEGHNAFLYLREGEAIERALPAAVFASWKEEFDRLYPPEATPYEQFSWRAMGGAVPESSFAYSSDSIWRTARYSRQIDSIDFRSLREFRGGFANDMRYNWWKGSIDRRKMPFFVMYEFSPGSVGCKLHWQGGLFWEQAGGHFEKIIHETKSSKEIAAGDVGRKAFLLCLPKVSPELFVQLELSPKLRASLVAANAISIIGVLCLLGLMIRIKWRTYLPAAFLTLTGLLLIYLSISVSGGKPLGALYTPHGGGDDGLLHESHGRNMARAAMSGDFRSALEGLEPVYWFTPGMRYFRAVEKVVFGDTNFGYTAFLASFPWIIYLILNHLCGIRWAWIGTFVFLILPASFSFAQYIYFALLGYSEPIGSGLFFIGLLLFLKSQPQWGGSGDRWLAFVGGGCLAASMFVRPNFALAVPLLGIFFMYASWRSRDFPLMLSAAAGLAFALWLPFHNYVYGHVFVLISASGSSVSVPLSPLTYLKASGELVTGNWQGLHIVQAGKQLWGWLWNLPELRPYYRATTVVFTVLRLPTLAVAATLAFMSHRKQGFLPILSWTAIAAHIPMFFIFSTDFRYAMLAWDLCAIATLVVIAGKFPHFLQHPIQRILKRNL